MVKFGKVEGNGGVCTVSKQMISAVKKKPQQQQKTATAATTTTKNRTEQRTDLQALGKQRRLIARVHRDAIIRRVIRK